MEEKAYIINYGGGSINKKNERLDCNNIKI